MWELLYAIASFVAIGFYRKALHERTVAYDKNSGKIYDVDPKVTILNEQELSNEKSVLGIAELFPNEHTIVQIKSGLGKSLVLNSPSNRESAAAVLRYQRMLNSYRHSMDVGPVKGAKVSMHYFSGASKPENQTSQQDLTSEMMTMADEIHQDDEKPQYGMFASRTIN